MNELLNINLKDIAEYVFSNDKFIVCGHVRPDGDCISSSLVLYNILLCLNKQVYVLLCSEDTLNDRYTFLPGSSKFILASEFYKNDDELKSWNFFFVDVPNEKRVNKHVQEISKKCKFSLVVDHHASSSIMGDLHYCDTTSASTSLILWELHKLLLENEKYNPSYKQIKDIAICSYTGLVSDTGSFKFQNADARVFLSAYEMVGAGIKPSVISEKLFFSNDFGTLKLKMRFLDSISFCNSNRCAYGYVTYEDFEELGVKESDAEDLVDLIRSIKGIEVCCLLRVTKNIENNKEYCRCSLRAKGNHDVGKIARKFGGGGHKAAAGFNLKCNKEQAFVKVEKILNSIV